MIYFSLKKFIIKSIIISFSLGLDCSINIVIHAIVLLSITLLLFLYNILYLFKKYINKVAPIRLLPSIKAWSLTIKYNKLDAFSSRLGYNSLLSKELYMLFIIWSKPLFLSNANRLLLFLNDNSFITAIHSS